jgi:hypothetical protein
MKIESQKEHEWLQQLTGNWIGEGEAAMEPGQPTVKWTTTEAVRSIGGVWIIAEGQGEMPEGGPAITMMTLGYDPQKSRYVGTFIGSMMTNLWVYEGTLDASGKVLTLDTEGPVMGSEGKMARYKDIIEIKSADERVLTSRMLGEDGHWTEIMTSRYRRVK